MNADYTIHVKAWTKAIVLILIAVLFTIFLLLNMGAVIEPRVHLIFAKYERPGLLMVLLLAAMFGLIAGLLIRTVFATLRQLREARQRSGTARLEREVAQLKAASAMPHSAVTS
jgi:uncharacterized integral membrane protein